MTLFFFFASYFHSEQLKKFGLEYFYYFIVYLSMSICLLPLNLLMTYTATPEILIGSLYYISYETAFLCEQVGFLGQWGRDRAEGKG